MVSQRFAERRPDGPRVRADGLEFPDVVILLFGGCLKGPEPRDHFLADVEAAVADGRQQPLVQTNTVGIALEVPQLEGKLPQGVGAVNNGDDPLRAGEAADPRDGEHLRRQVGDVAEMENLRLRRDGLFEAVVEIVRRRGDRELQAVHFDVIAPHPLVPRRQHTGVVLLGRDHLIASLQVDPVLYNLQRLARAARQGHLLGVASKLLGHAHADRLDSVGNRALIKNGRHVDHIHVAHFGFQRHPRRRAGEAVIQVDDRAVQLEIQLDFPPVELVLGDVFGRSTGDRLGRCQDALKIQLPGGGRNRSDRSGRAQK